MKYYISDDGSIYNIEWSEIHVFNTQIFSNLPFGCH